MKWLANVQSNGHMAMFLLTHPQGHNITMPVNKTEAGQLKQLFAFLEAVLQPPVEGADVGQKPLLVDCEEHGEGVEGAAFRVGGEPDVVFCFRCMRDKLLEDLPLVEPSEDRVSK